jgi:hypothetical protein
VIEGVQEFCHSAPDDLTVQTALVSAPDGQPVLVIVPTWSGDPDEGEQRIALLMSLGKPIHSDVKRRSLGEALAMFDGPMTDTHSVIMDNRCSAQLTREIAEVLVEQTVTHPGPGCSIITHEFRGCAARVPIESTAFEFWLNIQRRGDLWEATHSPREMARIERARPVTATA